MKNRPFVISCIQFLLLAIVFLIPLVSLDYLAYSVIEKTLFFYLLVEIAFCLWFYALLQNKAYLPPRSRLLIAGGVFLVGYTLAGVLAASPEIAFWSNMTRMSGLILLFHIAAFVLLLVSTVRDELTWRRLMGMMAVSGALVAMPTHLAYLFPTSSNDFIDSTFGNSSYVATFLIFSFFFSLILFFHSRTRQGRVLFATCAGIIFFSPLFLTLQALPGLFTNPFELLGTARAASASVLVGLTLAGLAYLASSKQQSLWQTARAGFVACFAVLIILSAMVFVPASPVQQKLTDIGIGSRLVFWESAVAGIKERPLLGFGPEHYFVPFYQYFEPSLLTEEYDYELYTSKPHSAYLEVLVSGGIVSFTLYMAIWIVAFILLWRIWKEERLSRAETALLTGLLFAYLLQNIVFFDTLSSYMGVGIVIAYLAHISCHGDGARIYPSVGRRISWPKATVALGVSVTMVYFFVLMPFWQQAKLIDVLENVTVMERTGMYESLFSISQSTRTSMAAYIISKTLEAVPSALASATPKERELILKDLTVLRQTTQLYISASDAVHYRQLFYLTHLHLLETVLEPDVAKREGLLKAVKNFEPSLEKLSPRNPQNYWVQAQRELLEGDAEAALATLRTSDEIVPDIPATQERIEEVEEYLRGEGNVPFFTN